MSSKQSQNVKVCARFRPINEREKNEKVPFTLDIKYTAGVRVEINSSSAAIQSDLKFDYDHVFGPETTQLEFYNLSCKPVVDDVLKGYNGTIFAYGQTGSGKSWSMMGSLKDDNLAGLIPRASRAVFDLINNSPEEQGSEFKISCSYLEIYNEKVRDLFDTSKVDLLIRESPSAGIYVENLTEEFVGNENDIFELLDIGANNRQVRSTDMNAQSSRSHSVFTIRINSTTTDGTTRNGKLNLVDLAGSEKVGKTGATGHTLEEAKQINKSLSSLGMCINSLVEKKSHIPYRDSKLTRILQESLGGNSKTTMICACSPHPFNIEETISTLKFGQRAKSIKLNVKINAMKSAKELMLIIEKLEKQIALLRAKNANLEKQIEYLKAGKPIPEELLREPVLDDDGNVIGGTQESSKDSSSNSNSGGSGSGNASEFDEKRYAELQLQLDELKAKHLDERNALEEEIELSIAENDELTKTIKKLEADSKAYEEEMDDLLDENDKLRAQQTEKKNTDSFSQKQWDLEKKDLNDEIEELYQENEKLEAQLKKAKETQSTLSTSSNVDITKLDDPQVLEELARRISEPVARGKIMAEIDRLRGNNNLQKELVDQSQKRVFNLESDLDDTKSENADVSAELKTEIASSKRDSTKAKEDLVKVKDDIRRVERDRYSYEKRYEEIKLELNSALARLKVFNKTEVDLKKRIEDLRAEVVNRDEEIAKYKLRLEREGLDRTGRTSNIPGDLESYLMNIYGVEKDGLVEAHSNRENKNNEVVKTLRITLEEDRLNAEDIQKKLKKQIDDQTVTLNNTKQKADKYETELKQVHKDLDSAKKELLVVTGDLKNETSKYNSKVQEYTTVTKTFKEHINQLEQDIEQLTVVREELKQQLEGKTGTDSPSRIGRNWANELMELRNSLRKVTAERNKLEDEANHSRKENMSYRNKLKAAQNKLDLNRTRITQLSEDLETSRAQQSLKKAEREDFKRQKDSLQTKIDELQSSLDAALRTNAAERRRNRVAVPVSRQSILIRNQ
jgi:kinesin family protein 5